MPMVMGMKLLQVSYYARVDYPKNPPKDLLMTTKYGDAAGDDDVPIQLQ